MPNHVLTIALASAAVLVAGCDRKAASDAPASPAAAMITEAEAAQIQDATEKTWTSMDAAKIKALYGPEIVGFDAVSPALAHDRAAWDKFQDDFAAAKIDKLVPKDKVIQVLDADTFVVSGVWDASSTAVPANAMTLRCTVVSQKSSGGQWLVANEHCSRSPGA